MRKQTIAGIAASAAVLSGCATTELPSMSEMLRDATDQTGRACVRNSDIDGYGVMENNVISIDAGRNYYLATVSPGCDDVGMSSGDRFGSSFGEICGRSGARMSTDTDACDIHQVFEFDDREEAFEVFNEVMEAREGMGED